MLNGIDRLEKIKIRAGVGDQKVISVFRKADGALIIFGSFKRK